MRTIFAAVFASLLFIGCSGTTAVMNRDLQDKDFSNKKILIIPFPEDIIDIDNKDDVLDDFEDDKREPEVVIRDRLYKALKRNSGIYLSGIKLYPGKTDSISSLTMMDTANCFIVDKGLSTDSILYKFYIPKKEVFNSNKRPDVVLVLNRIYFSRNFNNSVMMYTPGTTVNTPGGSFTTGGHMTGGGTSEFLGANVEFIVYDYDNDEFISYGNAVIESHFMFAMTKSTWEDAFYQIAREIFKKTPFKWKESNWNY